MSKVNTDPADYSPYAAQASCIPQPKGLAWNKGRMNKTPTYAGRPPQPQKGGGGYLQRQPWTAATTKGAEIKRGRGVASTPPTTKINPIDAVGVEILNHCIKPVRTHVRRAVALVGLASTQAGEAVGLTTPTPGTQLLLESRPVLGGLIQWLSISTPTDATTTPARTCLAASQTDPAHTNNRATVSNTATAGATEILQSQRPPLHPANLLQFPCRQPQPSPPQPHRFPLPSQTPSPPLARKKGCF